MALIKTVKAKNGVTVNFFDDAYINCTPEELERRREEANRCAERILVDYALRTQAGEGNR